MNEVRRAIHRLIALFRSDRAEADLAQEIQAHLLLLEDKFLADGMSREEARYAARRAFGGVEQAKEHQRDERSFRSLAGWSMDLRLGARMLIKYPGLTLIGGVAMAFAIATGTAAFEFLTQLTNPSLPLDEGSRIVGIRLWHAGANSAEDDALHDFVAWRDEIAAIDNVGAFRTLERNLISGTDPAEPVPVAEISASAFELARVPPPMGRVLTEADEQSGAPDVVVIGQRIWQTRLGGDPGVVGRTVRIGTEPRTIVGVMPEGFRFPVFHSVWIPLRLNPRDYKRGEGPAIRVFGRLASGMTLEEAQAEFTTYGQRAALAFPETHEQLRPQVIPYATAITGMSLGESRALFSINAFLVALLLLICGNVALLMFARAVTREDEIAVRSALGASRGRIIAQLFAEALVLSTVAVVAGVAAAHFVLRWWLQVTDVERGGRTPFWFDDSLAPATVLYAAGLAVLGAACAGIIPALKVTGRRLEAHLRRTTSGAGGHQGFGGVWTAVIVAQVAATVAFPATTFFVRRSVVQIQTLDVGFPSQAYLSARIEMDEETPAARFQATLLELQRRLAAEPDVAGLAFTSVLPRTLHAQRWVEVDGDAASSQSAHGHRAGRIFVTPDYFGVLGTTAVAGREFHSGDLAADRHVVIVNQSFVDQVFEGRNPVGRRLRYVARGEAPGPWHDIVGTVKDLGTIADPTERAGVYHPMVAGTVRPVHVAVHVKGDPEAFAARFHAVAAGIDPALRLHDLLPLDKVGATLWLEFGFLYRLMIAVSALALLLSLAGIYSIMAFTVSRRRREIGIRVALGANRRRIVGSIFRRPLVQMALGIGGGGAIVFVLTELITGLSTKEIGLVLAYMALMMVVCLLACRVPTWRALTVEPSEALRTE